MSRLVAYTLMGLLALLILVVCVSVLFEAPREGGHGPPPRQPSRERGLRPRASNGTYSFCFIRDGRQYYFEVLGWVEPNSTLLRRYLIAGRLSRVAHAVLEGEDELGLEELWVGG